MSTEQRTVRPYTGLDRVEEFLSSSFLAVGDERVASGESLTLQLQSFLARQVTLYLAESEEQFESAKEAVLDAIRATGFEPEDIDLLVVMSTPSLKIGDIALRHNFSQLTDLHRVNDLCDPTRPRAMRAPHGGCRVDLFVCLARALERAPLRPWRRSTWLARARFEIGTDLGSFGFTPRPLTDEKREELKLPAGTARFIFLNPDELLDPATDDSIELWVDADLLARITANPKVPAARAFQRQLFIDVVTTTLFTYQQLLKESNLSVEDVHECLLGRLLAFLAGPKSPKETDDEHRLRLDALLQLARTRPGKLVAMSEDACDFLKDTNEVLAG
jgi:hypothetical protein